MKNNILVGDKFVRKGGKLDMFELVEVSVLKETAATVVVYRDKQSPTEESISIDELLALPTKEEFEKNNNG